MLLDFFFFADSDPVGLLEDRSLIPVLHPSNRQTTKLNLPNKDSILLASMSIVNPPNLIHTDPESCSKILTSHLMDISFSSYNVYGHFMTAISNVL